MRLFTALWLPPEPSRHLEAVVNGLKPKRLAVVTTGVRRFRFLPADKWHLTLRFHGEVPEPEPLGEWLERRVRRPARPGMGLVPPRLRLAGAGVFRGVLWVGVEPAARADAAALGALVRAAGGDPHSYRAHLTIARWRDGRAPDELRGLFAEYSGPWWSADEVALVRSEPGREGAVYRTLHRVPVRRNAGERRGFPHC